MQAFHGNIDTDFMELLPETLLNNGDKFCTMELEHTTGCLGFSCHFVSVSTVALTKTLFES